MKIVIIMYVGLMSLLFAESDSNEVRNLKNDQQEDLEMFDKGITSLVKTLTKAQLKEFMAVDRSNQTFKINYPFDPKAFKNQNLIDVFSNRGIKSRNGKQDSLVKAIWFKLVFKDTAKKDLYVQYDKILSDATFNEKLKDAPLQSEPSK